MSFGARTHRVRLTSRCNSACGHCPIAGLWGAPDRDPEQAWGEIARARAAGADELLFERGEATLYRPLLRLVRRARGLGYRAIHLETNGRALAYPETTRKLELAGLTHLRQSFFAHIEALHNLIDGTDGAFAQARAGLDHALASSLHLTVRVPVVHRNVLLLAPLVRWLHDHGVGAVDLELPRPTKAGPGWRVDALVGLEAAEPWVAEALREGRALGMRVSATGFPLCRLGGEEAAIDLSPAGPPASVCEGCPARARCPFTWESYQRMFGTWELSARALEAA